MESSCLPRFRRCRCMFTFCTPSPSPPPGLIICSVCSKGVVDVDTAKRRDATKTKTENDAAADPRTSCSGRGWRVLRSLLRMRRTVLAMASRRNLYVLTGLCLLLLLTTNLMQNSVDAPRSGALPVNSFRALVKYLFGDAYGKKCNIHVQDRYEFVLLSLILSTNYSTFYNLPIRVTLKKKHCTTKAAIFLLRS
jgi:hypothetical protein